MERLKYDDLLILVHGAIDYGLKPLTFYRYRRELDEHYKVSINGMIFYFYKQDMMTVKQFFEEYK